MRRKTRQACCGQIVILTLAACVSPAIAAPRADGRLELRVVDGETGQPLAARLRLRNPRGRVVRVEAEDAVALGEFLYFDGRAELPLRRGAYTFELETGPEYRTRTGHFDIQRHADDSKTIEMNRFANLAEEGWYAGDLLLGEIHPANLPLVLQAEQLHIAPLVRSSLKAALTEPRVTDHGHWVGSTGLRPSSVPGLHLFHIPSNRQADLFDAETLDPVGVASAVQQVGGDVVPFCPADQLLPVYLATGQVFALPVLAPRETIQAAEVPQHAADRLRWPGMRGRQRFAEDVYYQALEAGLRLAPVAGSGAGRVGMWPPGAHRVYVHCGDEFSYDHWWDGLRAGNVFVTNGPLLRAEVRGQPPGHVFHIAAGETISLEIGLQLATRDTVEYLEVIKNGQVEFDVPLHDWAEQGGRLPPVEFDASGWFVIRAVTNRQETYQLAITAPYYVEVAGTPRVSRTAVEYFLSWVESLPEHSRENTVAAVQFWRDRLAQSNAP